MRGRRTVWLVGMMGAGKSSVGAELARRLGCRFVDTDALVEKASGAPISEIFRRDGEAAFRAREREAIRSLCGQACVAALGGGAIAQPGASQRLARAGVVVYLRARPESLLERLGEARGRPLLEGLEAAERLERLTALQAQRAPAYESASIVVDTDGLAVGEIARLVEQRLGELEPEGAV